MSGAARALPVPDSRRANRPASGSLVDSTPGELDAIATHASALGVSPDEYIRQTAAERATAWQRECDALQALARRRGRRPRNWYAAEASPTATSNPEPCAYRSGRQAATCTRCCGVGVNGLRRPQSSAQSTRRQRAADQS